MRKLLISIMAVILAGCSSTSDYPADASVKLYKDRNELTGINYIATGKTSGVSCQLLQQDRPPSIPEARSDLQHNAAKMGNAVILDSCQSLGGFSGCYQAAVCQGTAIRIQE